MIKTGIGIGIGIFFGGAMWRNAPTLANTYPETFGILVLLALFIVYRAGRFWRFREHERAVAVAASEAAASAHASVRAHARSTAQAAAVVQVNGSSSNLVTPEQIQAQWSEESDLEMDRELAEHYAMELNRAHADQRVPERTQRRNVAQSARSPEHDGTDGSRPTKVLYLPRSSMPPP